MLDQCHQCNRRANGVPMQEMIFHRIAEGVQKSAGMRIGVVDVCIV